jgi:hypothetical protein
VFERRIKEEFEMDISYRVSESFEWVTRNEIEERICVGVQKKKIEQKGKRTLPFMIS